MATQTTGLVLTGAFCSDQSRAAGERLFGSAAQVRVWLVLEYTEAWGAKAVKENALPEPAREWLAATLEAMPMSRALFVKQPPRRVTEGARFFVAVADERQPRLYGFRLEGYEDLTRLDVGAMAAGDPAYAGHLETETLYLVCTNGERDLCCARRGVGAYLALAEVAGERVWQCSHLGGHRFAANCLTLPHGILYGQVDEAETGAFVAAGDAGEVSLPHYRGRTLYEAPAQAAEYFLRQQTGLTGAEAYRFAALEPDGEEAWNVRFDGVNGEGHTLRVEKALSDWEALASCGDEVGKRMAQYHAYHVAS